VHALLGPPRHLWKMGLVALGLTLALLVIAAAVAPAIVDLATPPATTVETISVSASSSPPAWLTDPMAPPTLLQTR
jgi:hypothetical protein